jgi:hypothetical protein
VLLGDFPQNLTPCSATMDVGMYRCLLTVDVCPYCSSMISTQPSVSSLQTTMRSCNKGMLSEIVYMLAGHSTPTPTGNVTFPVNSIVAEHGVKLCENHPTAHVLTECHWTRTCVANTELQELVGNGKQSFTIFDMKKCWYMLLLNVCLSSACME